jgi:hypothetical protein
MEKKIQKYAKEFFAMENGEAIAYPEESLFVSATAQFTRRSLKHFVESRLSQGNTLEDIYLLLERVCGVIENPELNIPNPKKERYPTSSLLGRFYEEKGRAVMVVLDGEKENGMRDIISLHFKKKKDFYHLAVRAKRGDG